MGTGISPQLETFCQALVLGLSIGLVYDLLRAFRLRLPRLTAALDLLYCLIVTAGVFFFALYRANGRIPVYALLGIGGGSWLFFAALSAPLRPVWDFPWGNWKVCAKKFGNREKISFILSGNAIQ